MKSSIYIAGPFFSLAERERIDKLAAFLRKNLDMAVFVPHEECAELKGEPEEIFKKCKHGLDHADIIMVILDGLGADSGTCWEMGYAVYRDKAVVGVRADFRICEVYNVGIILYYGVTTLIQRLKAILSKSLIVTWRR
jgi:nucleoside 2-deoxyribosyltransferase